MTQTNVDFSDNPTGSQLLDNYLAKEQENNLTTNSGIQRPSYAVAGTKWLDTSSEPWALKMYTGSGDVVIGYIDKNKGTFKPDNALPDLEGQSGKILTNNGEVGQWVNPDFVRLTGNQTINGAKTFEYISMLKGTGDEGGEIALQAAPNSKMKGDIKIDSYKEYFRVIGTNSLGTVVNPFRVDIENNKVIGITPSVSDNSTQVATTQWFNNKIVTTSSVPTSPTTGAFYFVFGEEKNYAPLYKSYVDISANTYTATKDGWIFWRGGNSGGSVNVNGVVVGTAGNYTDQPFAQFMVSKGDVITCNNKTYFRFIPFTTY